MSTEAQRAQRAANGSRRKRDREAAGMTFDRALAWAEANVPEAHAPFAASSALTLRMLGHPVTPDNVRANLKAQGRA